MRGDEDLFSKLDTDGDGVLTKEEFEQAVAQGTTLEGEVSTLSVGDAAALWVDSEGPASKRFSNNTEFFLGLVGGPVAIFIVGFLFVMIGEVTGQYELFTSISMLSTAGAVIGGTAWGFTTGHQSFAWGLLSAFVVVPLVLFGLCLVFIMVFWQGY